MPDVQGNTLVQLLPLILIIALLYFVMIRPQQKRRRQLTELQNQLHRGQRVMTSSGLFGTVSAIDDDQVILEIAPGVDCRYSKNAIIQVLGPVGGEEEAQPGEDGKDSTA